MDPIDIDAIVDAKPEWTDAEIIERLGDVISGQGLSMVAMSKEIGLLKADYADTVTCLSNERRRFAELLAERDAEIARLCVPPGADVLTMVKTAMCCEGMGSACDDPVRLCTCKRGARVLQQYGDERAAAANAARKKAEGWCDVHGIYHRNFRCEHGFGIPLLEIAAEARAAAKEEYESANLANQQVFAKAIRKMAEKTTIWRQAKEATIASLLSEEMVELAARLECDHHTGGDNSVWDSGLTNKESRRDSMRAVLHAVAAKLGNTGNEGIK